MRKLSAGNGPSGIQYAIYSPQQLRSSAPLVVAVQTDLTISGGSQFFSDRGVPVLYLSLNFTLASLFSGTSSNRHESLQSVLETVKTAHPQIRTDSLIFYGYRDGAQLALQFAYLYPSQVLAVSLVCPVLPLTELDDTKPWPQGIEGVRQATGRPIDIRRLSRTPVHIVVASDGPVDQTRHKLAEINGLIESLNNRGIVTRRSIVKGANAQQDATATVLAFFSDIWRMRRG